MKKSCAILSYIFIILNFVGILIAYILLLSFPTLLLKVASIIGLIIHLYFALVAIISLKKNYRNISAGVIIILLGNVLGGIFYILAQPEPTVYINNDRHAEFAKNHMGLTAKSIYADSFIYLMLALIAIIWLFPFFSILMESFRMESTGQVGYIFPKQFGFGNYVKLWTETSFPKWYLNTFIMAIAVSALQTIIVLSMSYTLSRLRFKGRRGLMNFMLVLGMFPGFLTMIVLYTVLKDMGLTGANAIPGLILVYVASSGMGYYVSKGFFDTLPRSLDEAARVDGATRFQVFYKVILPLSKPIVIYTILVAFMAPWGDFIFAKYIARTSEVGWNVAVGLKYWIDSKTLHDTNYTMFCAGGVCVALPVTLLFMFLQKYYVEGVTGGAVKG